MKNIDDIIECYSCGLFIEKTKDKNLNQRCPRCNSKLSIDKTHSFDSLYYCICALLLFILLNNYPLISFSIGEKNLNSTLFSTVLILFKQGFFFVASIILFTIIIAPLLNLFIILISFMQIHTKIKIFSDVFLYDTLHFFKTWSFLEVFSISIIVTYIKLIGMSPTTKFDLGFFILLFFTFFFYMSNIKFEGKTILGE